MPLKSCQYVTNFSKGSSNVPGGGYAGLPGGAANHEISTGSKEATLGTYEDSIPLVKRSQDVRNLAGEVLEEQTSSLYGVYRGIQKYSKSNSSLLGLQGGIEDVQEC